MVHRPRGRIELATSYSILIKFLLGKPMLLPVSHLCFRIFRCNSKHIGFEELFYVGRKSVADRNPEAERESAELHTAEGREGVGGPKPETDTLWGISDMETILRRGMAPTYDVCTGKEYTKIR